MPSGGQKRRVSFSVALLHNPLLLILDEPTVGVDPLLSQSIWQHLVHLTTVECKTVVISTHYIEEAKQANVIGLMREGVLLAEQSPASLMEANNCDSLEQAFLKLSQNQTNALSADELQELETSPLFSGQSPSPLEESMSISAYRLKALLVKSVFWMRRNIPIMLFLIILPMVQTSLFNVCIGNNPVGLPLGVFNEEVEVCSGAQPQGCHIESQLSCRFIKKLRDTTFNLVEFNTLEEGEDAVLTNRVWSLVHFSKNYTQSFIERSSYNFNLDDSIVNTGNVDALLDMSDQYIGNMIKRDLYLEFVSFQKELFRDCGWPEQLADVPIKFNDAVYGSNNPNFVHYSAPAMVTIFAFYLPMMFTGAAIMSEKIQGLLQRSLVAGMNIYEVAIAHSIIQLALIVMNTAILLVICYVVFEHPMVGSYFTFISLMLLVGLSGMCCGFAISLICDSDVSGTVTGLGTFYPLVLTSGMMWPREGAHDSLKSVSWMFPLTLATDAYRAIVGKAWGLGHPVVYNGFLSCLAWIVAFLALCQVTYKLRRGIGSKT